MANILTIPESGIFFDGNTAGVNTAPILTGDASGVAIQYDGYAGIEINSSATGVDYLDRFSVEGANGRLFGVTDEVTGTVFSVNDAAGLPIIEVESTSNHDKITIGEYGTDALVVSGDSVGIGTTSPSSKLDIFGTSDTYLTIRNNGGGYDAGIRMYGGSAGISHIWHDDAETNPPGINFGTSADIATAPTSQLYIKGSDGNVGIGTASPDAKLHVVANNSPAQLYLQRTGSITGNYRIGVAGATNRFYITDIAQSQDRLVINESGNVGIGTTSPADRLHLGASSNLLFERGGELRSKDTGGGVRTITRVNSANELEYGWSGAGPVKFMGGGSYAEKMRIHTNGNVGIGILAPTFKLHVKSDDANDDIAYIHHDNPSQSSGTVLKVRSDAGDSSGYSLLDVSNSSGTAFYVRGDRNVGIGTTSPAGVLEVAGNTDTNSNFLVIRDKDPTSGSARPSIRFAKLDGTVLGQLLALDGTNQRLQFSGNNTEDPHLTVYNNGNVGIGTSSPSSKLHVAGDIKTSTRFFAQTGTSGEDFLMGFWDAANARIESGAALPMLITSYQGNIKLGISGGTTMTVKSTAVGIGTTSPDSKLHVANGNVELTDGYGLRWGDNSVGIYGNAANETISVYTSAAEKVRITSAGNVGIGTTSPHSSSKLHVNGQIRAGAGATFTQAGSSAAVVAARSFGYGQNSPQMNGSLTVVNTNTEGTAGFISLAAHYGNTNNTIYSAAGIGGGKETTVGDGGWGGYLNFFTTSDGSAGAASGAFEHMRITADGNVGIGATNPLRKLHVVGDFAVNAGTGEYYGVLINGGESANPKITIGDWHNSSATIHWDSSSNYLRIDSQHSSANAAIAFTGNDGVAEYMRITSAGNVGIGTTSPEAHVHIYSGNSGQTATNVQGLFLENNGSSNSYYAFQIATAVGKSFSITNAGNVGIGTTSPSELLEVSSNTGAADGTTNPTTIRISDTDNGSAWDTTNSFANLDFYSADSSGSGAGTKARVGAIAENSTGAQIGLAFSTTNSTDGISEKLRIDAAGNVGINKTSPAQKLDIGAGHIRLDAGYSLQWDNSHERIEQSDGHLEFFVNNTESMTLDTNGLGIGTTNPAVDLQIGDGTAEKKLRVFHSDNTYTQISGYGLFMSRGSSYIRPTADNSKGLYIGSSSYQWNLVAQDATNHTFSTNGSESVRINSSGNVGIGTTSPSYPLEVAGAGTVSIAYQRTGVSAKKWGFHSDNSNTYWHNITDNVLALTVSNAGNVGIGTTSPDTKLHVQGTLLLQVNANDQNSSEDSTTNPSTTTPEFMRIGHTGTYSDGRYTHEWVKLDRTGNLPLYLRQSKGTANSFENIARFGEHSYSTHRFEVFGSIGATGLTVSGDLTVNGNISGQLTKKISGDGSATTFTVTHSFGTPHVMTQLLHYGNNGTGATYEVVNATVKRNSDNAIDVVFGVAPTSSEDYLALITKMPAIS